MTPVSNPNSPQIPPPGITARDGQDSANGRRGFTHGQGAELAVDLDEQIGREIILLGTAGLAQAEPEGQGGRKRGEFWGKGRHFGEAEAFWGGILGRRFGEGELCQGVSVGCEPPQPRSFFPLFPFFISPLALLASLRAAAELGSEKSSRFQLFLGLSFWFLQRVEKKRRGERRGPCTRAQSSERNPARLHPNSTKMSTGRGTGQQEGRGRAPSASWGSAPPNLGLSTPGFGAPQVWCPPCRAPQVPAAQQGQTPARGASRGHSLGGRGLN